MSNLNYYPMDRQTILQHTAAPCTDTCIEPPIFPFSYHDKSTYTAITRIHFHDDSHLDVETLSEYSIQTNQEWIDVMRIVDKKRLKIMKHMIRYIEPYELFHVTYESKNDNYALGIYDIYRLVEPGHRFELLDNHPTKMFNPHEKLPYNG